MKNFGQFWFFTGKERGDFSLPVALLVTAVSVVGVGAMIDRSSRQRLAAKTVDMREQAAQSPINSAILAKSLLTVPDPSKWNTTNLKSSVSLMPSFYPDPYISSQLVIDGRVAQSAWKVFNAPSQGADAWTQTTSAAAIGKVTLLTTDASKATPQSYTSLFSKGASGTISTADIAALTRVSTNAEFSLKNCVDSDTASDSWTGTYCANVTLTNASTGNVSNLALGALPTPPPPICTGITAPSIINAGTSNTFTVQASGVVIGYTLHVSTTVDGAVTDIIAPDPTDTIFTAANRVNGSADLGPFTINLTSYNATRIPAGTPIIINVTLSGIGGTSVSCPTKVVNTGGPTCSLKLFDTVSPYDNSINREISKPHQNRRLWLRYYVNNGGTGYTSRIQFAAMTNLTAPRGSDANGIIMPGDTGGPYDLPVTAQGNEAGVYVAAGRIWSGGKIVATCSIQGQMSGQWYRTYAQDCNAVCSARAMAKRFDWNSMSCVSGEQWLSRPFAAKLANTNNEAIYRDWLAARAVIAGFHSLWGAPADMDYVQVTWPYLGKKTISEGAYCYWTNKINSLAQCNGGGNNQMAVPGCQKLDWDETDKTLACYCGK